MKRVSYAIRTARFCFGWQYEGQSSGGLQGRDAVGRMTSLQLLIIADQLIVRIEKVCLNDWRPIVNFRSRTEN